MPATKKAPLARRSASKRTTAHPKPKKRATATKTRGKRTSAHTPAPKKPARKRTATLKSAPAQKPARKTAKASATRKRLLTEKLDPKKLMRRGTNKPKFKSKPKTMSDAEARAAAPNGVAVGHPRIKINWKLVDRLAKDHCPITEIASKLGVSPQTLRERPEFLVIYERGWDAGKMSLRRAQFKFALAGNTAMLKHLGAHILGQIDRQEHTGADGGPLQVETTHKVDLSKLSTKELEDLQALVEKASDNVVDAEFETISQPLHPVPRLPMPQ